MQKSRVIFDTNVLIIRLLRLKSGAGRAVRRLLDLAQPLVSKSTLEELAKTPAPFKGISILAPAATLSMSYQSIMELCGTDRPLRESD